MCLFCSPECQKSWKPAQEFEYFMCPAIKVVLKVFVLFYCEGGSKEIRKLTFEPETLQLVKQASSLWMEMFTKLQFINPDMEMFTSQVPNGKMLMCVHVLFLCVCVCLCRSVCLFAA